MCAMELQTISSSRESSGLQLKKVLVPVDFSPLSQKAFRYALRLSQQFKTELTLLHVLEPLVPPSFEGFSIGLPDSSEEPSEAKKSLKALVDSARGTGVSKVRSTCCRGLASHEIVEAAKEFDVDLIVIGTHGYTGWKHFCIGSTAERVVRAAPCPVLVVREKEHEFR
jgi:universal stress protein A